MFIGRVLPGVFVFLLTPCLAQGTSDDIPPTSFPSQQLLEFLADFGSIDDDTYDLIEYHAMQDSQPGQQETPDEN